MHEQPYSTSIEKVVCLAATVASARLQCRFHAHRLDVADTTHPRQLRDVETKQATQPAVVRQQPLRDVGDGLSTDAG
jgi:hypothetical protein